MKPQVVIWDHEVVKTNREKKLFNYPQVVFWVHEVVKINREKEIVQLASSSLLGPWSGENKHLERDCTGEKGFPSTRSIYMLGSNYVAQYSLQWNRHNCHNLAIEFTFWITMKHFTHTKKIPLNSAWKNRNSYQQYCLHIKREKLTIISF